MIKFPYLGIHQKGGRGSTLYKVILRGACIEDLREILFFIIQGPAEIPGDLATQL